MEAEKCKNAEEGPHFNLDLSASRYGCGGAGARIQGGEVHIIIISLKFPVSIAESLRQNVDHRPTLAGDHTFSCSSTSEIIIQLYTDHIKKPSEQCGASKSGCKGAT